MKTTKFDNMIQAFASDFELAIDGEEIVCDLDAKIKNKDERLLQDCELLSELAYLIRSGKAEIHLVETEED